MKRAAYITHPGVSSTRILEALLHDATKAVEAFQAPFTDEQLEDFLIRLKLIEHRVGVLLNRWDDE